MEKIIEIKHDVDEHTNAVICGHDCHYYDVSCREGLSKTVVHDNFYEYETPTDKCPGPGKHRMALEKVEEIKCSKCGHINHGIPLDDLDIDDIDYLKKLVVKCWKCFQYVRFPKKKVGGENQGFEPRGIAIVEGESERMADASDQVSKMAGMEFDDKEPLLVNCEVEQTKDGIILKGKLTDRGHEVFRIANWKGAKNENDET